LDGRIQPVSKLNNPVAKIHKVGFGTGHSNDATTYNDFLRRAGLANPLLRMRFMTDARHSQRGFTLLELLIVVAIFILVTTIAIPNVVVALSKS
jgi:prepilin-type N-terminal cleavage/methylation domain-containing protein